MTEIYEVDLLKQYLKTYQLESIFNEDIMPYLSLNRFDKGEFIFSQGEHAQFLYFLVKGKIKIYRTSSEGKTLILSFKTPIEVVGDIEYVQEINTINTVEAVSTVHMIGIRHTILKKFLKDYSPFLNFILKIITEKFYLNSNSMSLNLMSSVEVRLASYLLSVTSDENEQSLNGQLSTTSLTDTANLIGTSYRHLNRVIHQFCADGLVERSKGLILIKNRDRLKTLAGGNIYE
jgi:CRP-like cAMP-binding protein